MGAITTEDVAIAQLVVYIPTALLTIWVVFRHGAHKQLGWIYLAIFSIIRIAGSVLEILSVKNPSNASDQEWALILQSIGLSPLLLSTLGILKRIFDEVSSHIPSKNGNFVLQGLSQRRGLASRFAKIYTKRATATSRRSRAVQLLHVPALIALILVISGVTDEFSDDVTEHAGGKTKAQAGVIIYVLLYLATFLIWAITLPDFRNMQSSQTRMFLCVMVALPLIAVRLVFTLISTFGNNPQFAVVGGDEAIRLGMTSVEEFVVVIMYTILGVFTPKFVEREATSGRGSDVEQADGYDPTYQAGPKRGDVSFAEREPRRG